MASAEDLPTVAYVDRAVRRRRNLVIVRIGNSSRFLEWFRPKAARTWDLMLSYYAIPREGVLEEAEIVVFGGRSKYSSIFDVFCQDNDFFSQYERILVLDDDIEMTFRDVDFLIGLSSEWNLDLCQASLSEQSITAWSFLKRKKDTILRYTNLVEVMMPLFSQRAFSVCLNTFGKSVSSWGLDFTWSHLLGYPRRRIGVIDLVVAQHTRPVDISDGPFYRFLRRIGVDFEQEVRSLRDEYGIKNGPWDYGVLSSVYKSDLDNVKTLYLDTMERVLTGMIYRDPPQDPWSDGKFALTKRENGRDWPLLAHSMIGLKRMQSLRRLSEMVIVDGVRGDFIETGAWRGGACIMMRAVASAHRSNKKVFVADSFEGLPPPSELYPADANDNHHVFEQLAVSLDDVKKNFDVYSLLDDQVVFLKGWFKDTLPSAPIEELCILRLDGDMYGSTIEAITPLYPKLSRGGFCIVDDGNVPGCRAAIDDYRSRNGISESIVDIDGWGFYWRKDS